MNNSAVCVIYDGLCFLFYRETRFRVCYI